MFKGQTRGAFVTEADQEREEEPRRSTGENQRNQKYLQNPAPRGLHWAEGAQIRLPSQTESSVKQEIPEMPQIKEEPEEWELKQEEEQLPEFTVVCVKSEEQSSPFQQRQSEHRGLIKEEHCGGAGADISLDPHGHLHSETEEETDNDEDWEPAASSSTAQMETEADGDHYNQVQIKDTSTAAHNSGLFNIYMCGAESRATVTEGHVSGTEGRLGGKKCECTFCKKSFRTKADLRRHIRIHTGEKPHSCFVCNKTFSQKSNLTSHMKTHTGEKPHSCTICNKTFSQRSNLTSHMKIHTGERPYSCSVCNKTFAHTHHLKDHMRSHTREKQFENIYF